LRVLITSTRTPHALAAVRSFGEKGWEVTAGDSTRLSMGKFSRFVTKRLLYPPMTERPTQFVEALLHEVSTTKYDLIFPTFEEIFLIARFRKQFAEHTTVLLSDYDDFMRIHHKTSLTNLSRELGVPVPPTVQPADLAEMEALAEELPYPAVIKLPDVNNSLGLSFAENANELKKKYAKLVKFFRLSGRRMPLIQKKIEGDLIFSLFLADRGETVGTLIYKPIRMFPEGNGTAFYRESIRNQVAEKSGAALIEKLKWHGFIGFDFIVDNDTGKPYLIDANPRPNPAYQTGLGAGVDFTQMSIDMATGNEPEPNLEPREGVRFKTLFVETIWFAFQFAPGKHWWRRVKDAFSVFKKRTFNPDVHRKDDRLPSFMMYLYINYFLFVINPIKPKTGGYCYGCNFTLDTADKVDVTAIEAAKE
jgi:predicted ATP-grasp superfamily ATP-dependent carboligase